MMNWSTGWNGGGWVAMSLMMLFWAALIGLAIWAAVRLLAHRGSRDAARRDTSGDARCATGVRRDRRGGVRAAAPAARGQRPGHRRRRHADAFLTAGSVAGRTARGGPPWGSS